MRITDFQDQDIGITESIGPRFDRSNERLASTDVVIIQTRRRLLEAAKALRAGGVCAAAGVVDAAPLVTVLAGSVCRAGVGPSRNVHRLGLNGACP